MAGRTPSPLSEGRSKEKEVFQLVNAMRTMLLTMNTSFQFVTAPPVAAPLGEGPMSFRFDTTGNTAYIWNPVTLAWVAL
jgi:hypothetical protein